MKTVTETFIICARTLVVSLFIGSVPVALGQTTTSPTSPAATPSPAIELDPFTVQEDRTRAWNTRQTFSGTRVAEDLLDIATNISIINKDFMSDLAANRLEDVVKFAASGVNSRVSYADDFSVRGFREPTMVDGMDMRKFNKQPLYDIENLEIVKGPGGLVFGNEQSLGGTVNYTTKRPTAKPMGDMQISYGSYNTIIASATQRGPLTQDGRIRYRGTVGFRESDGYLDTEYDNDRLISGSIDWKLFEPLLLRVDAGATVLNRRDYFRRLVDPATQKVETFLPEKFSTTAPWSDIKNDRLHARAELIYSPFKDLWIRGQGNWVDNHNIQLIAQPTPGLRIQEAPNYRTVGQRHLYQDKDQTNVQIQLDAVWKHDFEWLSNQISAGVDRRMEDGLEDLGTAPLPNLIIAEPLSARPPRPGKSAITWQRLGFVTDSERDTAYIRDALKVWRNRVIVSFGARYISKDNNQVSRRSATVPDVGLVYKATEDLSVYANYKEAYRPMSGVDIFDRRLQDIVGENKEVGVKFNLFDGRLFGSAAYFDIFNDPVMTQVQGVHPVTGQVVFGNAQVGKQTNKGFEADFGFSAPVPHGNLLAFVSFYNCDPRGEDGLRPFRVVSEKYTAFGKYELSEGSLKGLGFGMGYAYFGSSRGTGIPIQPAYDTVAGVLSYKARKWMISLHLDNLLNEKEAIIGSEANFSVYTALPFNWKISFTQRW